MPTLPKQENESTLQHPNRAALVRPSQNGVALIVVLIFIVALTSLAIYSARDVSLGERLARNQLDSQVAREAAEAALRDAEFDLQLPNGTLRAGAFCARNNITERPINTNQAGSSFGADCLRGQCSIATSILASSNYNAAPSATNYEPWWPATKGGLWNDDLSTKPTTAASANCASFTGGVPFGTFTGRTRIPGVSRQPEYLIEKITLDFVRITARGFGRNPNTEVVLQSYFRPFQ
jgi:type IV pilus assembly protein PilX